MANITDPSTGFVAQSDTQSLGVASAFVIGLTGGIGSGKTAASDWFAQQGITVVDADVIAHQIMSANSPTLNRLVHKFGDWILTDTGELNRGALRTHVFSQPSALIELEAITHPAIRQQAKDELSTAESAYVILSAPLLLEAAEAGLANLCQRILVIDAPEHLQIHRASQRDGQSIEKIKAIMANQLGRSQRNRQADDIVVNDGTLDELYQQLARLHTNYLRLAAANNH